MKRASQLLDKIIQPENLELAVWKAAKGKRHAAAVLHFQKDLEINLLSLREQIRSGQIEVGEYRYFKVFEPKERQICASAFREQVLHHALMSACHERFDAAQIADSFASRVGKGTFAALDRARFFAPRHEWFLKLDLKKFFENIHHEVLKKQLARIFKERHLLQIFFKIIDSYEASPGRGLPIGNLTSQYFANHFLAGLDHFVKEKLRRQAYVRYMDDLVLWHDDPVELKNDLREIKNYVETQLLGDLKPPILKRSSTGLPFLGFHIFPHRVWLLQKSKARFIRKSEKIEEKFHSGDWHEAACQRHFLPLREFVSHADSQGFQQKVWKKINGQTSYGR